MKQKKLLSALLASLFLLTSMVFSASAAFTDDEAIVNKDAVAGCVELKIINGRDDGSFDPTAPVTRAEMAKMITVILNGGVAPTLEAGAAPTYSDTTDHWALAFIEYCSEKGIVAGMGDGTYAPNSSVTGAQVAKMLLVTLGYDAGFEGFVGETWAEAVDARAIEVGLYTGLTIDAAAALTRDNAAQMIWNAVNTKTVQYEPATEKGGDPTLVQEETTLKDKCYTDVPAEPETPAPVTVTGEVGKTYETAWFDFSVDAVKVAAEYKGKTAADGYTYLIATITEKNSSSEENNVLTMGASDFFLKVDTSESDVPAEESWDEAMMPATFELKAGASATYDLVFTIPVDAKAIDIVYVEVDSAGTIGDTFVIKHTL